MKAWGLVVTASMLASGACALEAAPPETQKPALVVPDEHPPDECEGTKGTACPAGKYCAAAVPNRCPGIEITGACRPNPEACTHIYQPVCGCDGQTYDNDCLAATAGVALAYEGSCAPFCGGFAGIQCPGHGSCLDNTTDSCDPLQGDSDCASLCQCNVLGLCEEGAHWDPSPEVCACVWE